MYDDRKNVVESSVEELLKSFPQWFTVLTMFINNTIPN